ncbi:hypothetical protein [Flexithrix dorotheae]|uniref:hypothetical protein n=1 Tax=Flexithrix dorotheae TaxID=70993 RepID=UPI00036C17E4|nr:hypothetical protein [Flexithrix dorotheae]
MNLKQNEHTDLVDRIIGSSDFGRSKTYQNLLRYLVKGTMVNDIPKETTIAAEIFGKSSFNPAESTMVRVYLFNLRKKLENYFENAGKDEPVILEIPKGSYKVEFNERTTQEKEPSLQNQKPTSKKLLFPLLVLLFISIAINLFFGFSDNKHSVKNSSLIENEIWKAILVSEIPATVMLGDMFIFMEYDENLKKNRAIRDFNINSQEDFEEFTAKNPDYKDKTENLTYNFLVKNSAYWIKSLTEIFLSAEKEFNIRVVSRLNPKDMHDNNMIVCGLLKNLGWFKNYFQDSEFNLLDDNNMSLYVDSLGKEVTFGPSGDPDAFHTDYSFVAKYPGPNNNVILILGGFWDTGASQATKNFTDPKMLEEITRELIQKFGEVPEYFEILFEVSGVDRTELNTKIVYLNEIEN